MAAFRWDYRTPVSTLLDSPMTLCGRCHGITQEDMGEAPISVQRKTLPSLPYYSLRPPLLAQKMRKRFAGPSHHLVRGWLAVGCLKDDPDKTCLRSSKVW